MFCKKRGSWKSVQEKVQKKLKQDRGGIMCKPEGSPKAPPHARIFQTRNNYLSNCCSIVLDLLQKKVRRCKQSEMVAENSESVAKKVNRLLKVVLNPWSCWRSGNKLLKKDVDTMLVIWHALGRAWWILDEAVQPNKLNMEYDARFIPNLSI